MINMQETMNDNIIKLESMKNMSIDQIIDLYKMGYIIDGSSHIEGLPDSPETSERLRKYAFMSDTDPNCPISPGTYERWERQKKYGFTGKESRSFQNLQGVSFSDSALLLIGIGVLAYFYVKKNRI